MPSLSSVQEPGVNPNRYGLFHCERCRHTPADSVNEPAAVVNQSHSEASKSLMFPLPSNLMTAKYTDARPCFASFVPAAPFQRPEEFGGRSEGWCFLPRCDQSADLQPHDPEHGQTGRNRTF